MLLIISFIILCNISYVYSSCDNQCSGHGTCMVDDVCNCYTNYGLGLSHDSGDCSERICPYEIAWVDTPNKQGLFHKYTECASRGICNRQSGECECFDGYEGKGCSRSTCPNDCSGHGTCILSSSIYGIWDYGKVYECQCDATYGDYDCSKRLCPYGIDVLDIRDNLLVSAQYQVQQLVFLSPQVDNSGNTFALTFTSK